MGGLRSLLAGIGEAALSLAWPRTCEVCGRALSPGEDLLCLRCELDMPVVNLHGEEFGELHRRLASPGMIIERAGAMFWYYRDDAYARLIQSAKYDGRPRLARVLARRFAASLMRDGFFDGVEVLLPVPLHRLKLIRRGYNQSIEIARGLSEVSGVKIGDNLRVVRRHASQTRRDAYGRWLNARGAYGVVRGGELEGRHVMIVDDVLTTGATLLACAEAVKIAAPGATVSVVTLAATHQG